MKKTIILFASVLLAIQMQAQVKVGSNGNMMVGLTTGTPLSVLSVCCLGNSNYATYISNIGVPTNNDCMRIFSSGSKSKTGTAVDLFYGIKAHYQNTGLNIQPSINYSYGPAYGVKSVAGNSGHSNCGVYGGIVGGCTDGQVTTPKSAGVFGSSSTYYLFDFAGVYAGYFCGDVRVTSGTIYGTLASPVSNPSSSGGQVMVIGHDAATEETVSNKLSDIQLLQTIIPAETSRSSSTGQKVELPTFDCDSTMSPEEKMAVTDRAIEAYSKLTVTNCEAPSVRYSLNPDQLKQVFPELVYEDKYGNVSINYVEMVPLLLQYINELSEEVKAQRAVLAEYTGDKTMMTETNKRMETTATSLADAETDILSLDQNNPNPFSETTSIGVTVPESVKTANIFIYDMSGKEIKRMAIAARGKTRVSVAGSDLTSGMYLYSLIADGKVVSTKRMILAK